jgi:hypothetical protein
VSQPKHGVACQSREQQGRDGGTARITRRPGGVSRPLADELIMRESIDF